MNHDVSDEQSDGGSDEPSSPSAEQRHGSAGVRARLCLDDSPGAAGHLNESGDLFEHNDADGEENRDFVLREQDRFLPIANIARAMKKGLPESGKVSKDAKECCQECVSEFISFITSEASERCQNEKRKTINGEDILWAMQTLGFENFVEPLKLYLAKYRESTKGEKAVGGADWPPVGAGDGTAKIVVQTTQPAAGNNTSKSGQQQAVAMVSSGGANTATFVVPAQPGMSQEQALNAFLQHFAQSQQSSQPIVIQATPSTSSASSNSGQSIQFAQVLQTVAKNNSTANNRATQPQLLFFDPNSVNFTSANTKPQQSQNSGHK